MSGRLRYYTLRAWEVDSDYLGPHRTTQRHTSATAVRKPVFGIRPASPWPPPSVRLLALCAQSNACARVILEMYLRAGGTFGVV